MEISAKVFPLENSNAIRIPELLMKVMSLKDGDSVIIEALGHDKMIVRKNGEGNHYPSIAELFQGYSGSYQPVEMGGEDMVGRVQR